MHRGPSEQRRARTIAVVLVMGALCWGGCVQQTRPRPGAATVRGARDSNEIGRAAAEVARSMVGTPYRYGGETPAGFDCSGLVRYSFERAGRPGLPHSVAGLVDLARPVAIESLEVGDLLFFALGWLPKKSHVGIYLGERRFVHAPSGGKSVEIVSFDHVYWGRRIELAGRLGR